MSGMTSYFVRRLLLVPVTFLAITFMVYTVLRYVPGGPIEQAEAQMLLGGMGGEGGGGASGGGGEQAQISPEGLEDLKEYYALDAPVVVGYLQWLGAWPRKVADTVPTVPREGHEEVFELVEQHADAVTTARAALLGALGETDLVLHDGRLWRPVPPEEVPADVRERAELLAARTLGERYALSELLEGRGLAFYDGSFFAPAEPPEEAVERLENLRERQRALARVEAETGYVRTGSGGLLQRQFAPLVALEERRAEAAERLREHLAKRKYVPFRHDFWRPLEPAEIEARPEFFEEMDSLVAEGFGKRDDLVEALYEEGYTFAGGRYYTRVSEETRAASPEYFETASALMAARNAAAAKLREIEEEEGFRVTPEKRIKSVETRFSGILQLDFGRSYQFSEPVLGLIGSRIEISLWFGLTAYILTWLICVPLGVMKAIKHRTWFDTVSSILVFIGYAIPGFVLAILLLSTLAVNFDFFPLGGYKPANIEELGWWESVVGRFRHMFIPVVGYMVAGFATMTILMKNSLLDNLGADYVRTAFAKGLTEKRVIFVHALRNSLIPITAGIGHALGLLFAGSFLIEKACNIPGMGLLGFNAILARDYPIILGLLVFLVLIRLFGNIISDIIWALIDPRIRFG